MAKPALPALPAPREGWLKRALPKNRQWTVYLLALVVLDAAAILGSLWLAFEIRFDSRLLTYNAPFAPDAYRSLALVSTPLWLVLFWSMGLYQQDNLMGGLIEYKKVVKACTSGIILIIMLSFFWREEFRMVSRGWLLFSWAFSTSFVLLARFGARHVAYALRRRGWLTDRVLVVGANEQGMAIAEQWNQSPTSGMQVVGFLDDFKPLGTPVVDGLEVVGRPRELRSLARELGVTEVVLISNAIAWETFEEILASNRESDPYTLRLSPGFYEILATGVAVTNKTFVPLFTLQHDRLVGVESFMKGAFDFGLGLTLLLLSLPVMAFVAVWLKLADRTRPVLVRHRTIGQGGVMFHMLKFRSGCDEGVDATPRPAGRMERWLCRSELDKLPQLFNVVAGQMSLVGPRPQVVGQTMRDPRAARYQQALKPGMTGPWAVSSYWISHDETENDTRYVRNWTLWLDIQILFQTAALALRNGLQGLGRRL
jgi:lipopolysaccharide/colanic/teichoic acid biosynthesis glycosyltransferase